MEKKLWCRKICAGFLICATALLGGCMFTSTVGLYDGSDCPGWLNKFDEGNGAVNIYRPSNSSLKHGAVIFSTTRKGLLFVHVDSSTGEPPLFAENKIRILLHDGSEVREIEAKEEFYVHVPENEEFTLVIPAFRVGQDVLPGLNVHFRWAERKAWLVKKLALR